ncbi:hypothetical protein CHUAL_000559 [Chamberlinius hualienensis]
MYQYPATTTALANATELIPIVISTSSNSTETPTAASLGHTYQSWPSTTSNFTSTLGTVPISLNTQFTVTNMTTPNFTTITGQTSSHLYSVLTDNLPTIDSFLPDSPFNITTSNMAMSSIDLTELPVTTTDSVTMPSTTLNQMESLPFIETTTDRNLLTSDIFNNNATDFTTNVSTPIFTQTSLVDNVTFISSNLTFITNTTFPPTEVNSINFTSETTTMSWLTDAGTTTPSTQPSLTTTDFSISANNSTDESTISPLTGSTNQLNKIIMNESNTQTTSTNTGFAYTRIHQPTNLSSANTSTTQSMTTANTWMSFTRPGQSEINISLSLGAPPSSDWTTAKTTTETRTVTRQETLTIPTTIASTYNLNYQSSSLPNDLSAFTNTFTNEDTNSTERLLPISSTFLANFTADLNLTVDATANTASNTYEIEPRTSSSSSGINHLIHQINS